MTYDNDTGVIKHRFCPAYHWTAFWAVGALCCAALGCGGSVAAGTEAGPQAPATVTDRWAAQMGSPPENADNSEAQEGRHCCTRSR